MLCCDNCARVFHVGCSGLSKAPEGEEDWFCPVCKVREGGGEGGEGGCVLVCMCMCGIASFPGPAQLSVACSTVKRERAWYLFSRE